MRIASIEIDSRALGHNIAQINQLAPTAQVMLMYKANAYGHGLEVCTHILLDDPQLLDQVQAIGVATLETALQLRQIGWNKTIVLIEGVFSESEWLVAIEHHIQCVIHHQSQLNWALTTIPLIDKPSRTVWLKYNTGMNRLGFGSERITSVAKELHDAGYYQILTSHFANADEEDHGLNREQGTQFSERLTQLRTVISKDIQGSLCNSAGIVHFPQWHYDWVRAGIMAYGSSPTNHHSAHELNLQAVMTFSCRVIAIQELEAGDKVGYGSRWIAEKPSRIAIISAGYGDGYPRVVNEQASVIVHSQQADVHCPIVGRVAMDMTTIDISHIAKGDINIDDEVTLWGNGMDIDQVASSANTISYELLCRLSTRPKRMLID